MRIVNAPQLSTALYVLFIFRETNHSDLALHMQHKLSNSVHIPSQIMMV